MKYLTALLFLVSASFCSTAWATENDSAEPIVAEPPPETKQAPEEQEVTEKLTDEDLPQKLQQAPKETEPFALLGSTIKPGESQHLYMPYSVRGVLFNIPVVVSHGSRKGPTICISAAVHGDELNGIEIARRVVAGLDLDEMSGTVVAIPVVNMEGFLTRSRYMADRRDLNRFFPGRPDGVTPERYAHTLFTRVILHCNMLVDVHTGSHYRTNLPQLRADLTNEKVKAIASYFGSMAVLHSPGEHGMLRNAATRAGIPAVTMEVGGPLALELEEVAFGVKAIRSFMSELGMTRQFAFSNTGQSVYFESEWMVADHSGILIVHANLGDHVAKDEKIATIVNPVDNSQHDVKAAFAGTILGKAENQFVSEGFLIFRLGKPRTADELAEAEAAKESEQEHKQPRGTDMYDEHVDD